MADHEDYLSGEAPASHHGSHEDGGSDEISIDGLAGELADNQPPKAHDLGGAKHNADTLADLNTKVSDATLEDKTVLETTMDGKIATHAALEDVHHDYEEGTWTPVLVNFVPSAPFCYTVTGHYTKTGRLIHIECKIVLDAGETLAATINIANITGLPFAVSQNAIGVQGSTHGWATGYHGFALFYTDDKIWVETFPAQGDTIYINGFYRTAA